MHGAAKSGSSRRHMQAPGAMLPRPPPEIEPRGSKQATARAFFFKKDPLPPFFLAIFKNSPIMDADGRVDVQDGRAGLLREKLLERYPSVTAAFLALDSSGRGALAVDAFADAIHTHAPGLTLEPTEVAQLLRRYDGDRDGRVSYAEFAAALDGGFATKATEAATSWTPPRPTASKLRAAGKPRGSLAQPLIDRQLCTPPRASFATPRKLPSGYEPLQRPLLRPSATVAPKAPASTPVRVLAPKLAFCCFPAASAIPQWATSAPFFSVTRAGEELSLLVTDASVPHAGLPYGVRVERGWRALRVGDAPLDFGVVGVLAGVAATLAAAEVPMVFLSTFGSTYVCVREEHVCMAAQELRRAGHHVSQEPESC